MFALLFPRRLTSLQILHCYCTYFRPGWEYHQNLIKIYHNNDCALVLKNQAFGRLDLLNLCLLVFPPLFIPFPRKGLEDNTAFNERNLSNILS